MIRLMRVMYSAAYLNTTRSNRLLFCSHIHTVKTGMSKSKNCQHVALRLLGDALTNTNLMMFSHLQASSISLHCKCHIDWRTRSIFTPL